MTLTPLMWDLYDMGWDLYDMGKSQISEAMTSVLGSHADVLQVWAGDLAFSSSVLPRDVRRAG